MNRIERQNRIRRLIRSSHIGTQEEIKHHLQKEGISVTQATLSRGLREIGLLELRDSSDKLYYSLLETSGTAFGANIRSYILKVARVGLMPVLHTNLGEVDVLVSLIDSSDIPEILEAVTGADTSLVIYKDEEIVQALERDLSTSL